MKRSFVCASMVVAASLLAGSAIAGPKGTTLTGTKTATTTMTQTDTYTWTLQKRPMRPDQVTYIVPQGQETLAQFVITATRSGPVTTSSNTPVVGEVCVTNTGTVPTKDFTLVDTLYDLTAGAVVAGPIVLSVGTEIPADGVPHCFPYSFPNQLDPMHEYENRAVATIDNWLGFEGMAHSLDINTPVIVTHVLTPVNMTGTVTDVFSCAPGFSCVSTFVPVPVDSSTPVEIPYDVVIHNDSVACIPDGAPVWTTMENTATLTQSSGGIATATASLAVYPGTCPPTRR